MLVTSNIDRWRRRRWRVAGLLVLPVVTLVHCWRSTRCRAATGSTHRASRWPLAQPGPQAQPAPVQDRSTPTESTWGTACRHGGRATCSTSATQPGRTPDTSSLNSKWGHLGYDSVVLDDPGQQDGSTIVVGGVRGTPTSVTVSIDATSAPATIACFRQASGWCSYKANVPSRSPLRPRGPRRRPLTVELTDMTRGAILQQRCKRR